MATVCVFCASSTTLDDRWLRLATEVGSALATAGHVLVSGGGRVGMMGAVASGARSAGGHTIGVIPDALLAREVGDLDAGELVMVADLAERKAVMLAKADAFLVLPGGIGTLDELFEVWTMSALGIHDKPVVLLDADGFFTGLRNWLDGLAEARFVHPQALTRLTVVSDISAAFRALRR